MWNTIILLVLSFVFGSLYYYLMESTLPKDSTCNFIASPLTDIIAFITGCIIIYKGIVLEDNILMVLGGVIVVEHIWQILPKFTMEKIIWLPNW
jgi:hypothetical protein